MTEKLKPNEILSLHSEPSDEVVPSIESLVLGDLIGTGGNNNVYEIKGSLSYVARIFKTKWDGNLPMITELKQAIDTVPHGVSLARIMSVGMMPDGRAIAVMERAPGTPVHNRWAHYEGWHTQIAMLANMDPLRYSQLVQDRDALFAHGLNIDPSKSDNIMYDPERGFTYIDLSVKREDKTSPNALLVPMLDTGAFYNKLRGKLSSEDIENISTIIELLRQAGETIDEVRVEEIMRVASDHE